jgi:hypothetical protein
MSRKPIALSPDLLRLQNEGYDLEIREGGYLLVKDVPYVDAKCHIRRGTLISKLNLAGNVTNKPGAGEHVAFWTGDHPCHSDGRKITTIENPSPPQDLGDGVRADFMFSAKADYRDYHHKITAYIGRIAGEAAKLDPTATACTFPAIPAEADDGVFKYIDTASSRIGIGALNDRLAGQRVGIVANGGTGSYILDLVAKTNVAEIHTFDGDVFSQHNAFRSPGAPTLEQLQAKPQKVSHFAAIYSNMRRGIVVYDCFLDVDNISLIDGLDFVFLSLDRGAAKRMVVERLIQNGTPFVEVGMGVLLNDGQLGGIVRVTTSTPANRDKAAPHISYGSDVDVANEYATNIQIAELNALNAALAVIRWKKLMGVYRDLRDEYYSGYSIATGEIVSEGTK